MTQEQILKRENRHKMMLEEPIVKVIPLVALPMIIAMLIDSIYNITDTYFVSQLGTAATAAVGVNSSLMFLFHSIAMGFGTGASSYISRLLGAKKYSIASKVGSTALFTAILTMIAFAVISYIFINPMVTLMGATETVKPYSIQYALWILASSPFTAGTVVLSQLLRSEGSTKFSMFGMVSGCVINIALDPILINVMGLGVAGAAIATGISKMVSFTVLLIPFLKKSSLLEIKPSLFTPKKEIYSEIAKMGIPTFLRSSLLTISFIVTNNIAGSFGDTTLAAATIANKCTRVAGTAILGLGLGFQPVAGYCWGAKKYTRVRKAFWTCSMMGISGGLVLGALLAFFAKDIVSIFTTSDSAEIIALSSFMIITQCITLIMRVWGIIVNGFFQALGRPVGATILGLSRQLICFIPSIVILSIVFGVYGLASAHAVSDVLTTIIALPMVLSLLKKIKTLESESGIDEKQKKITKEPELIPEPQKSIV